MRRVHNYCRAVQVVQARAVSVGYPQFYRLRAVCHYDEFSYAECRGTINVWSFWPFMDFYSIYGFVANTSDDYSFVIRQLKGSKLFPPLARSLSWPDL